jgi:UMF1 family MFS transporter
MQETSLPKGDPKVIRAWCWFDWANSVYPLVITTAVFPLYFEAVTDKQLTYFGKTFENTALYAYSISLSVLIVALLTPMLSGVADFAGRKKLFMQIFSTLGALASCAMFFFTGQENINFGLSMSIVASIGFAGCLVFYNGFLPEIAEPKDMDRVSARGFTMGYIGSSIQLIFSLVLIMFHKDFGLEQGFATRLSFLTAGLWWLGFAFITWIGLPEVRHKSDVGIGTMLSKGFRELASVFRQLNEKGQGRLRLFLLAFFFYSMGYMTVIYLATIFGTKELGMSSTELIITVMIIQFVAIAGSNFFAWLSGRIGNIRAIMTTVFIWALVCAATALLVRDAAGFYVVAFFVGTVMGGIQALSRSTYAKLLPETHDHASYYSFYDITEKIGITVGSYSFGMIEELTGSMRGSALFLCVFFAGGFLLLIGVDVMGRNAGKPV